MGRYETTACTFTGTPFPTTGTCSETYTSGSGADTTTSASTYVVPHTGVDAGVVQSIYTATITVIDATATESSGSGSETSEKATTATGKSSSGMGTGSAVSAKVTSLQNAAMITMAPGWMVLVGAVAGAAVGV